jgi:hypothetical protein
MTKLKQLKQELREAHKKYLAELERERERSKVEQTRNLTLLQQIKEQGYYFYHLTLGGYSDKLPYDGSAWTLEVISKGQAFRTEKEANQWYQRQKLIHEINEFIRAKQGDWKPDWSDSNQEKWFLSFDHYFKLWKQAVVATSHRPYIILYIRTEEIAQEVINHFNEKLDLLIN